MNDRPNCRVDWRKRRGTITQITTRKTDAVIQWDDRRSLDRWPLAALEVVPQTVV